MSWRDQRGMSLIEVIVAIFLLGVVTVALVSLFLTGNIFTAVARHDVAAVNQAQEILETVKSIPDNQFGTAGGGSSNTITLGTNASNQNDAYKNYTIALTGGTGAGQVRKILSYSGATRTATVDRNWDIVPDGTTTYVVFEKNGGSYPYRVSVQNDPSDPNLKTVTVTVFYEDRGRQREISLTTEKLRR